MFSVARLREPQRHSRAARWLVALLACCAVMVLTTPAHAYAWMVRHGYSGCATCHADPSGGETLTPYGRAQGDLLLRMRYGKPSAQPEAAASSDDDFDSFEGDPSASAPTPAKPAPAKAEDSGPSPASGFLWGAFDLPEFMLLGGSLRLAEVTRLSSKSPSPRIFPMQMDLYGQLKFGRLRFAGSIGATRVGPGSPHAHRAQLTTAQGYDLNAISRNHWVGFDVSDQVLVRAGRMNLPFGLRVPEHTLWVRDQTYTDRESDQQHGLALSYSGEAVRGELMLIAGNYQMSPDRYRERGASLFVERMLSDRLGLGVSGLVTHAQADFATLDQSATTRAVYGPFMRWAASSSLVLLAEADVMNRSRQDLGYVGFLQGDLEVTQGLHVIVTGEALDRGFKDTGDAVVDPKRRPGNGQPRFGAWLGMGWFFWHHLDLRFDVIYRQPERGFEANKAEALQAFGQLHAYL